MLLALGGLLGRMGLHLSSSKLFCVSIAVKRTKDFLARVFACNFLDIGLNIRQAENPS